MNKRRKTTEGHVALSHDANVQEFEKTIFIVKEELLKWLGVKGVLSFAATSTSIMKILQPLINERYVFNLPREIRADFKGYQPQKLAKVRKVHFPLPYYVKSVSFNENDANYSDLVNTVSLPPFLANLTLGYFFDQAVDFLPRTLTHLTFGANFNKTVASLPPAITHLTFGQKFNQGVDSLPRSITHLTFGLYFNQTVDLLPPSILHLTFGPSFNQSVNFLPLSITHLTFGTNFNQPVNSLPPYVTHITFGIMFNQLITLLPASTSYISFGYDFPQLNDPFAIDFHNALAPLPSPMQQLVLGSNFNQPLDILPICLTHLCFGDQFNQPITSLPSSLTHLMFGRSFDQAINALPSQLSHVTFGNNFNQPIDYLLPASLTYLSIGESTTKSEIKFRQSITSLPSSLLYLKLVLRSTYALSSFPPNLTFLSLLPAFKALSISTSHFPSLPHTLHHFVTCQDWKEIFSNFPENCRVDVVNDKSNVSYFPDLFAVLN